MKIKRFTAATMREVIRRVREEQGPDAVILSNRRVPDGIEVVAAVDYDESLVRQALRATPDGRQVEAQAAPAQPQALPQEAAAPVATPPPAVDPGLVLVQQQLSGMRSWLKVELSNLSWSQTQLSHPMRAAVIRDLDGLGVIPDVARAIAAEVPDEVDASKARSLPLGLLAKRIPVAEGDMIENGGVIALVGPTGVGKTTTIAKLAARFVGKHSMRDLALITTDNFRIGAREQLYTYGRLLGVPVFVVNSAIEMSKTMAQLADRKLVLMDTAGLSQRDSRLIAQFELLRDCPRPVQTLLVMSANSQACDLEQVVRSFSVIQPKGCVLTKLDETTRLGGALSVLVRHRLSLAYVCDGQQVPEDLHLGKAHELVLNAVKLAHHPYHDTPRAGLHATVNA